jgi:hypothetical protein
VWQGTAEVARQDVMVVVAALPDLVGSRVNMVFHARV